MTDPIGRRPHRVNLDGKSITELGISATERLPGTFAHFDGGMYVATDAPRPGMFVVGCDDKVGGSILTAIPAGDSVTADYADGGRVFALLAKAGTVIKANETPLKLVAGGTVEVATLPTDAALVVAVAIEDYTVPASPAFGHVKARLV